MARKLRIGDICEIRTPAGLAYVQFTHDMRESGELVRVLPGLHELRLNDFAALAKREELYFMFYTLRYALPAKQVEIVSQQPVPDWARPYPMMRLDWGTDRTGRRTWKIADASTRWTIAEHQRIPVVTELTPEQKKLSTFSICPHPFVVKRLAQGWTPERDEELERIAEAEAHTNVNREASGMAHGALAHYLYFPKKGNAEKAGRQLRKRGFQVQVQRGADGVNWLAMATKENPPADGHEMEALREELESLAEELGGEYDGWALKTNF